MKIFLILIFCLLNIYGASFSKSKKILLKKVYFDNKNTFYCQNPYEIKSIKGKEKALIIKDENFYSPRNEYTKKGKINKRALRVEWEHIMPAHNFGKHLDCWKDGGRKACRKDPLFKKMEADMMNLVPSIGEVNGDRSNFKFSASKPTIGQYGRCEMLVDFKKRRALVRDEIKGDIARIYFYMSKKYNIRLSKQERKMFNAWDKIDPINEWERKRKERILKLQKI